MDGDIHLVVVLINDADDFLIATLRTWNLDQSSELSDAEVDMHKIVARLHLLQLLHRERHLPGACLVRLEVVFMEPVEDLMVGEAASLEIAVHEPLVHGLVHGDKVVA